MATNHLSKKMVERLRQANETLALAKAAVGTKVYVWPKRGESAIGTVVEVKHVHRHWIAYVRCRGLMHVVPLGQWIKVAPSSSAEAI